MHVSRMLLPVTFLGAALVGCGGGGRGDREGVESAAVDSATRSADSAARAATTGEPRLASVMIGKHIGAGNRITEPTFQFAPTDTVYISTGLEGNPGEATLAARWLAQTGKVLDSTAQSLTTGAKEQAEFHLAPAKGWKPGTYLVTLFLDGDSVESKTFAVRQ
jgi:hypothetical protein